MRLFHCVTVSPTWCTDRAAPEVAENGSDRVAIADIDVFTPDDACNFVIALVFLRDIFASMLH